MKFENEIKLLKLFNEKSLKLEKLYLLKNVKKIGFTVTTRNKVNGGTDKSKRYGPNSKSIDAFVLTLRFFIRDRDDISIKKISELYQLLPLSEHLRTKIADIKIKEEQYLTAPISYTLDQYTFTRSDALNIILFGSLAHARSSDKERQQYEAIENNTIVYEVIYNSFTHTLLFLLKIIKSIKELNDIAILELQKSTV